MVKLSEQRRVNPRHGKAARCGGRQPDFGIRHRGGSPLDPATLDYTYVVDAGGFSPTTFQAGAVMKGTKVVTETSTEGRESRLHNLQLSCYTCPARGEAVRHPGATSVSRHGHRGHRISYINIHGRNYLHEDLRLTASDTYRFSEKGSDVISASYAFARVSFL
ncbi:MAG: hypothetical protein GY696_33085 [Gammaproteobacteria bacterium]|nr:hypothetical protein [Gammaproteobacteria bacterium]